ncbi:hypothetical protein [Undibacterium curvum]|uniref:hypothetical protein n=1 Tax=Undibacterium curvum TaxID=2762294 RepID=UPI003D131B56
MNHGFSIGDSVATTAAALGNGHIVGFKTDITNGQRVALVRIVSLNPLDVRETAIPVQELTAPHMNLASTITRSNHGR